FDNLKYWVNKFLSKLLKEEKPDIDLFEEFWEIVKDITYPKPSELHSNILKYFLKISDNWGKFESFIDWWNLDNLRDEDFESEDIGDRIIMSLAERTYLALSKSVLKGEITDPLDFTRSVNQEKLEQVTKQMQELYEKYPHYEYVPYYLGKLLYAKGNEEEALSNLLPFARDHINKYWVWTLLGDLHEEDEEIQMACYCRGLLCKEPEKSLVRIRLKLAEILVEKEWYPEAKHEINKIHDTRKEKGWKIPNKIKNWMNQEWYADTEMPENNFQFYKKYAPRANSILAKDLDSMVGVITNVKKDKKVLGYIVDKDTQGGFNYSSFMGNPQPGDKIEFWSVPKINKEGENYQKVIYAETTDKNPKAEIVKELNGPIRVLEDKKIGFIEDAFIPPHMVEKHNLKQEEEIQAKAVLNFNKTKNEWGWMVVKINNPYSS
ncbi:MAG: tetratricopeptide repeat protein, partial [Bacteroidota bacterium]